MLKGDSKNIKFSIKVKVYLGHNTSSTYDMSHPTISGTVPPFISNQLNWSVISSKTRTSKHFVDHLQTFL